MLDFSLVVNFLPYLLQAVVVTLEITALSLALGLVLGLIACLMKISGYKLLRWPADFYIWFIRGTPMLVQLFVIYFGLPQIGIQIGAFPAAVIGLGINVGAYIAEIYRGGILSVPRGQTEAAQSLGMNYAKILWRIILPQAFRVSIPSLGNQAIALLKDSSLASLITVSELMMASQRFAASNFAFIEFYLVAAVFYLAMTTIISFIFNRIEYRLSVSDQ